MAGIENYFGTSIPAPKMQELELNIGEIPVDSEKKLDGPQVYNEWMKRQEDRYGDWKNMQWGNFGMNALDFVGKWIQAGFQQSFQSDLLDVQQNAMERHYNLQESALATSERIAQITSKTEKDLARINAGIESKKIEVAGQVKMHQIDAKLKAAALQSQFAPYHYGTPAYSGKGIPT